MRAGECAARTLGAYRRVSGGMGARVCVVQMGLYKLPRRGTPLSVLFTVKRGVGVAPGRRLSFRLSLRA
jgi:hypothetical protein